MAAYNFENISNDPLKRISSSMLKILKDKQIFFDIHCHIFNYKDVPDKFLRIRLPYNRIFLAKAERYLHKIIRGSDQDPYSNLAWFINYFKNSSSSEMVKKLTEHYAGMTVILCPLMMDMAPGINGLIIDNYNVQIEKMKALRNLVPDKLLPFFAVDPNNPQVIKNFIRVFSSKEEYSFFGIKIYPSLGYLPTHPVLMKLYEVCEEKKIPVTAHCGGATVHTSERKIEGIQACHLLQDGTFSETLTVKHFKRKMDYAEFFNHPHNWIPVMKTFPGLKLNLAHFGGEAEWKRFMAGKEPNWVRQITQMINDFPGLYTDFSYTLYNIKFLKRLKELMTGDEKLSSRILYGSDYYMVVKEGCFGKTMNVFKTIMREEFIQKMASDNPRQFLFG